MDFELRKINKPSYDFELIKITPTAAPKDETIGVGQNIVENLGVGTRKMLSGYREADQRLRGDTEPVELNEGGYLSQMRSRAKNDDDFAKARKKAVEKVKSVEESLPKKVSGRPRGIISEAVGSLARSAPAMLGNVAGIEVGTANTVAWILAEKYDELREMGVEDDRAFKLAAINAIPQAGLEQGSLLLQLGFVKNLGKVIKPKLNTKMGSKLTEYIAAIIKGAATEGTEEFLQTYPDELTNIVAKNPDASPGEVWEIFKSEIGDITKKAGHGAAVGGIAGTIIPGVGGGAVMATQKLRGRKTEQSTIDDGGFELEKVEPKSQKDEQFELRKVVAPEATAEGAPALPPGAVAEPAPAAPPLRTETTPRSSGAGEAKNVELYHVGVSLNPGDKFKADTRGLVWFSPSDFYGANKVGVPTTTIKIPRNKILIVEDSNGVPVDADGAKLLKSLETGSKQEVFQKAKELGYDAVQRGNDVSMLPETAEKYIAGKQAGEAKFTPEELAAIERFKNTGSADVAKAESVAEQYGLKYDGQADGNLYQFTDPVSKGTLSLKTPEEAPTAFNKLRADRGLELLDEGTLSDVVSKAPTPEVEGLKDAVKLRLREIEGGSPEAPRSAADIEQGTPEAASKNNIPQALRPAIEIMKAEVANGDVQRHAKGYRIGSTYPNWFRKNKLTRKDFDTVINKLEAGKFLTDRQYEIWQKIQESAEEYNRTHPDLLAEENIADMQKRGFTPVMGDISVGDLEKGDQIIIDTGWGEDVLTHKGVDKDGMITIEDGETFKVEPWDILEVEGVKKGGEALNLKQDQYGKQKRKVEGGVKSGRSKKKLNEDTYFNTPSSRDTAQSGIPFENPRKRSLFEQESKLSEGVREAQTEKTQRGAIGIDLNAKGQPKPFQFSDPQAEADYQRMKKGVTREPMLRRVSDTLQSIGHKLSREFEYLPKTKENAEVSFALRRLSKQKGVAKHRTLEAVRGITLNLNPKEYDLFSRKVILDDLLETKLQGKDVPERFNNAEKLKTEIERLDPYIEANPDVKNAIAKRKEFWEALKQDYIKAMNEIGFNVEKRLQREGYFRHQVMEYVKADGIFGTGKRLHSPSNRGYQKERKGSTQDINMDYLQAESEIIAQMIYDMEVANTISRVDKYYNIADKVRAAAKEQGLENWREAIPEGYVTWQPAKGNVFYMADTIPSKVAEELMQGIIKEFGVKADDLRKVMAVGGKRKEFVVPEEVAATLDNLVRVKSQNPLIKFQSNLINKWKQWQLLSPRRYVKYNLRNMTGDSDAVFVGNPKSFKKVPKAVHDLYDFYVNDNPMAPEMRDWFERGGMETTLQRQEMGELNDLKIFSQLYQNKGKLSKLPEKTWKGYWKAARVSTDFREAILRYANYLSFLDEMQASGGLPKDYAASIPEEVQGLHDIKDRAFMMSNDLLGAYDRVSVAGQAIRDHIFPFWSFPEVNTKRYHRMLKNAMYSGDTAEKVGRKVLGGLAKTPFMAIRVGRFMLAASALWTLTQLWNNLKYPEAEKSLPIDVKRRPHVILGVGEDGEVYYFNRIGAIGDLLEWFGLDVAPNNINDWLAGRKSLKEIAKEMAKAPINKVVQGSVPFIKLAGELLARRSTFPDAFRPRTIRDRMEHFARSFGLGHEYKAIMGKPSRPYKDTLYGLAVYKIDPLESAYNNIWAEKQRFLKTIGRTGEGFFITPSGNAMYNAKLAWRYGDEEAAKKYTTKYLQEYAKSHPELTSQEVFERAAKNFDNAMNRMNPLHDLTPRQQDQFAEFLGKDGVEELLKALEFLERLNSGEQFKNN